jgi:hypothetical protein
VREKGKKRRGTDYLLDSAPVPPLHRADDLYTISIHVLSDHSATVVKVTYSNIYDTSLPVHATGSAKREPGDLHDPETARLLATSRALEVLAARLRRKAGSRIRSADAIRRHHKEIKARVPGQQRQPRPGEITFSFRAGSVMSVHGAGTVVSDDVTPEFRQQVKESMDKNDELLRRLADDDGSQEGTGE